MVIRKENKSDYDEIYELVKQSFATTDFSDGTEADYLNEIRKKNTFIPELSLVAENEEGKLVGQIVLYKMTIMSTEGEYTELVLSPISVHPDYFGRGIASKLINESFFIAKNMGYKAVFLCGNPNFYSKFGFKPSYQYNIFHIEDESKKADYCMVHELIEGALSGVSGKVEIL